MTSGLEISDPVGERSTDSRGAAHFACACGFGRRPPDRYLATSSAILARTATRGQALRCAGRFKI